MSQNVGVAPARGDMTAIHQGQAECRTLSECLAVDFSLLAHTLDGLDAGDVTRIASWSGLGITRRMKLMAELLSERLGDAATPILAQHPSDTVRGWAAYMIGGREKDSLSAVFDAIRPLADDHHFGVREWAWLAVRPRIAKELDDSMTLLSAWTESPSECVRRFASEATRPRGVWSAHLSPLKEFPQRGMCILERLRADESTYVQNSVANWLNDAAKSKPDWVKAICLAWLRDSPTAATMRICKRAKRSIKSP